jgi:hypothetical protein
VTRAFLAGLAAALLVLGGCGKSGPPVRASDAEAKAKKPAPAANDPNAPAKKPAPEAPK